MPPHRHVDSYGQSQAGGDDSGRQFRRLLGQVWVPERGGDVTLRKRLTTAKGRRAVFEDGSEQDVNAIVWATGYRSDFTWIDIPTIKDERGGIIHRRGVTDVPGVLFIGLTWQHTRDAYRVHARRRGFYREPHRSRLEDRAGLTIRTDAERT